MVADRHGGEQCAVLRHVAQVPLRRLEAGHVASPQDNSPARDRLESGDRLQQGGLAAARFAHQDPVGARRKLQRYALEAKRAGLNA